MKKTDEEFTHFGYESLPLPLKKEKVRAVFSSVVSKYDLMNDFMSLGVHRIWKRLTVFLTDVRQGDEVLDLAGGTGDLTRLFSKQVGTQGHVYLADINADMIKEGRAHLLDQGYFGNISYVQADAENLPFPENSFNCICIGFGLRNVTNIKQALASMWQCIKPGGSLIILEFSKPVMPLLSKVYDFYSFKILPRLGEWVANDASSYQYLVESIRMHPDQKTLKFWLEEVGFEDCEYINLMGGIVAIHRGYKY